MIKLKGLLIQDWTQGDNPVGTTFKFKMGVCWHEGGENCAHASLAQTKTPKMWVGMRKVKNCWDWMEKRAGELGWACYPCENLMKGIDSLRMCFLLDEFKFGFVEM